MLENAGTIDQDKTGRVGKIIVDKNNTFIAGGMVSDDNINVSPHMPPLSRCKITRSATYSVSI